MLLVIVALAAASMPAVSVVRDLRARSNSAIAARDFARMRPLLMPDYVILPGSTGTPLSAAELGERLGTAFKDPTFVTYVRTPSRIVPSRSGKRISETGRWIGIWRKSDGEMRLTGIYQAVWVPDGGRWKLQNESFVSLNCTGSKSCSDMY